MNQTEQRIAYRKEIDELKELFTKMQPLVTEFGLNHHGSPVHSTLENTLTFVRERVKNLKERLE